MTRAANRLAVVFVTIVASGLGSSAARADVVDDHVAKGNVAARAGDWETAAVEYGEAERLLPGRSAVLSYNLGTAHAQRDELGLATFHLRRALQREAAADDSVAEAATRNLGIVRRRAELAAAAEGRQISAPDGFGDVARALFASPWVATSAVLTGWLAALGLAARAWWRRRRHDVGIVTGVVIGLVAIATMLAVGHAWSIRTNASMPLAIVVADSAEARAVAGGHGALAFVVQGSSQVRVIGSAPGWSQIRLPGGLVGWVTQSAVRRLDAT